MNDDNDQINNSDITPDRGAYTPIAVVDDNITISSTANTQLHNLGEQDVAGGTTPEPNSDDDVGEMRERVTGEKDDMENPQEINSAKIINEAEVLNQTS